MRKRQDIPPAALGLLRDQDDVITRKQALDGGLSDDKLEKLVAGGAWQRLDRGVYVGASAPVTWAQTARGGLLWAGPGAVLGCEAALVRHRLARSLPDVIDLWVPTTASRRPARQQWRLHYDGLGRLERAWGDPPVTSLEDTLLDIAQQSDIDGALSLVTQALAERRTVERRLSQALALRPRFRHRALLDDVVSERRGYDSALEYHLDVDVLMPHGLPRGRAQALTAAGTRVDRLIEEFDLVIETDGRAGHEGEGAFRDMERDNANTLRGLRTLRFGWHDVRLEPCGTARMVAEVLRQQGWTGLPCRCRRCGD